MIGGGVYVVCLSLFPPLSICNQQHLSKSKPKEKWGIKGKWKEKYHLVPVKNKTINSDEQW